MARTDPDDMRAADYVLGAMEPGEIPFFERDVRRDPDLAERVETWRRRVARLADEPATPQAEMRQRIEQGLAQRTSNAATDRLGGLRIRAAFAVAGAGLALLVTLVWRFAAG